MKKSIKFLAVFAFCFSVLANCLPTYAAAPSIITCPNCKKTAYYSGSEEKSKKEIRRHDVTVNETHYDCVVYYIVYEDLYRCGYCNVTTHIIRDEGEVHSLPHPPEV